MTKITFDRSGGILGQELRLNLDLDTLPANEALKLLNQIQRSDFFNQPENLAGSATPDEFTYTVTVESGATHHRVRVTDTKTPDSLRSLLDMLSAIAVFS